MLIRIAVFCIHLYGAAGARTYLLNAKVHVLRHIFIPELAFRLELRVVLATFQCGKAAPELCHCSSSLHSDRVLMAVLLKQNLAGEDLQ